MPERKIIEGQDEQLVISTRTPFEREGIAPYQLPLETPRNVYKPVISGMTTEQTHPGFPNVGIPPEVERKLYFEVGEFTKSDFPLDEKTANVSGLKITDAGQIDGLTGEERMIILSGPRPAVEAFGRHYRVLQKPTNISAFPVLPRNVRELVVSA